MYTTGFFQRLKNFLLFQLFISIRIIKYRFHHKITIFVKIVIGYYDRTKKFLIINILYVIVIRILNLDVGKPEGIGPQLATRIIRDIEKDQTKYPPPTLEPDLPAALRGPIYSYQKLLKLKGPIKPIKHRKPMDKDITCPQCGAPWQYIYSNATVYSVVLKKNVQKYKCKICSRQWFPIQAKSIGFWCPFCRKKLDFVKKRQEFDVYRCRNDNCPYYQKKKFRYHYRSYHFDVLSLQLASPVKPKIDLSKIHTSVDIMALAFSLHVNYQLTLRETASFLTEIFGLKKISHQTVANWSDVLAYLLFPLVSKLPISSSGLLAIDETYEKYAGSWGYLFSCIDAYNRTLLAPHFSSRRNVKAATTCLIAALNRIQNPPPLIDVVHDCYPPNFLAIQLINQATNFKLASCPVKGLKDIPPSMINPYRVWKNVMERYFGTVKGPYYRKRGFGSLQGAIRWNILAAIHFNYFRPHKAHHGKPPLQLKGLKTDHPIEKWNKLIYLAISLKLP